MTVIKLEEDLADIYLNEVKTLKDLIQHKTENAYREICGDESDLEDVE